MKPMTSIPSYNSARLKSLVERYRSKVEAPNPIDCLNLTLRVSLIPNQEWFFYGFVRKEAVITSQIEGTQATSPKTYAFQ